MSVVAVNALIRWLRNRGRSAEQQLRSCALCGTKLAAEAMECPVCMLRGALRDKSATVDELSVTQDAKDCVVKGGGSRSFVRRFENYEVMLDQEGNPLELGRGAMGITYKGLDVDLRVPVAIKVISERYLDNEWARLRFLREARAAARVHHSNVASVFHLGKSGGNYFYAMEFVHGETLEKLIRNSGRLAIPVALEVVAQVASGLAGIEKQGLVHRDIKPTNIMVLCQENCLEIVKIIDLGLAKGVTEENTISVPGSLVGTPAYASPEQFAGATIDIRSDLYSLGIVLWEMVSGKLPFEGSAAELRYQHQYAEPPVQKLQSIPAPVIRLLRVLLEKDPNRRFQDPTQLLNSITSIKNAIAGSDVLPTNEPRRASYRVSNRLRRILPTKKAFHWPARIGLVLGCLALGAFFSEAYREAAVHKRTSRIMDSENTIAVLPFEDISADKDGDCFADGIQDEILNSLAKVAQFRVVSRTSVMQYRAGARYDLRQIAEALGVANVLEGVVRRNGNRVRVSAELIDACNDHMTWADSYDLDVTDIFAIQSEVAQAIARKLTVTLSDGETGRNGQKPKGKLEVYNPFARTGVAGP
jgi:serine/threonine protein kinase